MDGSAAGGSSLDMNIASICKKERFKSISKETQLLLEFKRPT